MKPRRSSDGDETRTPSAPGAFTADGSFWEEGQVSNRGELDRFVRALVTQRRDGRLSPESAASAIEAAGFTHAFPCWQQWRDAKMDNGDPLWWTAAQAATSVEEFVKREGRGVECHWCGERWADGPEKSCPDERHRLAMSKEQVTQTVAAIVRNLEAAPMLKAGVAVAADEPETRWPIADETWPGWAAEQAARLRSLGLHPGLHRDDAVAGA